LRTGQVRIVLSQASLDTNLFRAAVVKLYVNIFHRLWTGIVAAVTGVALAVTVHLVGQMTSRWQIDSLPWTLVAFAGVGFVMGVLIGPRALPVSIPPFPAPAPRDSGPVVGPMNASAPNITPEELAAKVRTILQDPQIEITTINPEYGSWNLRVTKGKLDMEYIWLGPDGFGGLDLARPTTPDDTPFDLVDEGFQSVDDALEYLRKLARKYAVSG
jgi:hypothetical protein